MNVGDLFQRLSFGELSNLAMGEDGSGDILSSDKDKLVGHANAVLNELYSRFAHRVEFATVVLQEGVRLYRLAKTYAVTDTTPNNTAPRYITDSLAAPFYGNVIRIRDVVIPHDPELGPEPSTEHRLIGHDGIYIPNPVAGLAISVEYQAGHPRLSQPYDEAQEITLIPILEEALEAKVASRIYSAMNGEATVAKSQLLNARYEEICAFVKTEGLLQESSVIPSNRLTKGGWI